MTFTFDSQTVETLRRTASRLKRPQSVIVREAIQEYAKIPPEVRHRELVEAGIIDEKGRVLVRMPEPPKMKKPRKKKPKTDS